MSRLQILIFTQYFWPESFRINDVAKSLADKCESLDILTGKPNYPGGEIFKGYKAWGCQHESHQGSDVFRVPLRARGRSGLSLALNYLSFIMTGLLFAPWMLRRKKYDVIFVYAPSPILQAIPAIFMGWLKGCPVVLWVQDLWPASLTATGHVNNKLVLSIVESVVRFIYRHVDLLLVQSEAFTAPVAELAGGTPIAYLPNSVDDSFVSGVADGGPPLPGLDSAFSILFAGNIGTAQNVDVIVEAASILKSYPEIQFVVVGDGSRRQAILDEVNKQDLKNFHLPGRFPVENMPSFMKRASALLVTLADQEIFSYTIPSKVQAYLAAGRPILASMNGIGAQVVVDAEAGFAVPAESGSALAEAVLKLYRCSVEERELMGANGTAYFAKHFSHEMLVDRLICILKNCIIDSKAKQK